MLTHGWPGTVLELFGLTDRLARPSLAGEHRRDLAAPMLRLDRHAGPHPAPGSVTVPASFYLASAENGSIPPRALAERQYQVARWTELPRRAHFVAAEEPDLLAADIRVAFAAA